MLRWWNARLVASTIFGACVAACGAEPDTTIDITFDACAPIAIAMPADPLRADAVRDAFALWGMTPGDDAQQATELRLVFEDAAEAFHGLYDDENAIIYINAKITAKEPMTIVIAHELGHAMGLPHIGGDSVMRSGNTTIAPNAGDEARLHSLWGACSEP